MLGRDDVGPMGQKVRRKTGWQHQIFRSVHQRECSGRDVHRPAHQQREGVAIDGTVLIERLQGRAGLGEQYLRLGHVEL